jgi:DNA-3-methyladenine glycosylase
MRKRLDRKFFERKTLVVAKDLIGKFLVRRISGKVIAGQITETEAYCGPHDLASHAAKGMTPRTKIMFGPPGYAYIYLIYGMYYCLNIVTEKHGYPAAVLIRGLHIDSGPALSHPSRAHPYSARLGSPLRGTRVLNGPGKLCRELKIDKTLNHIDITKSKELWMEDWGVPVGKIQKTPRINIHYAKEYTSKPWRFVLESIT